MTEKADVRGDVVIYRNGVVHCSVCAPADLMQNEVESAVNLLNPSGLEAGWKVTEEAFRHGEPNPCECHADPERRHWLLTC